MSAGARRFPISLAMIVRDEEANLGRCLASVQGLVEEIVVVDTGSTDRTVAIAESYGATVHHFDWVDDFAAARNHALSLTTHPWRLVLDADEWIADRDHAKTVLDQVGGQVPGFIGNVGMLQVRADGALNDDVVPQPIPRLLPRHVSYTGRVHEYPTPQRRTMHLGLTVGHDGHTAEAKARKEGRNVDLLLRAVEETPGDPRLWYLLGNEYLVRERFEESLPGLIEAYHLLHPDEGQPVPSCTETVAHHISLSLIFALSMAGRHEDAIAVGEVAVEEWGDSAEILYVVGCVLHSSPAREHEASALWARAAGSRDRATYAGVLATRGTVLAARKLAETDVA
jgi:hypothetical protein